MKIQNHKLSAPARQGNSPNQGGTIKPTVIVLHYTASGGEDGSGDATYLSRASSRASAHVVVGRNGSIDQIVPFNKRAWHAGQSEFEGVSDVNDFSIGIEIDNWGWLKDGKSHAGVTVKDVFKGTRSGHDEWEAYPEVQLEAVEEVIAAIVAQYPIRAIVGHEDIAPGRKQDPGPALDEFKAAMQKKYLKEQPAPVADTQTKKTSTALRLRKGAGAGYQVLTVMPEGAQVTVLATLKSGWSQVKFGNRVGFAATQYLA
jgi:N-acetylmuramoyl-L-alanine amidase